MIKTHTKLNSKSPWLLEVQDNFYNMFRSLSAVCGVAVGSFITVKCLNYFEDRNLLNAGNVGLQSKNLELKLVQVLFRHGARTPLKLIPGLEETVWNKYELRYDLEHTKLKHELRSLRPGELPEETTLTRDVLRVGFFTSGFNFTTFIIDI